MKRYLPFVVLLLGILLRWYYISWSLPHIFHPDETRLLYAVNELSWENFNPHFFAYGSLPIYLLKISYVSATTLAQWLGMSPHVNFFFVGRALSAFWGSLTLFMIYLFGKRFFSERVALLSTAFLAFTVLHIQLSHFLTVDVMLTFFIVLALYFLAFLIQSSKLLRYYLLAGTVIGLALATKFSALLLYGVFFVVHILVLLKRKWKLLSKRHSSQVLWGIFIFALLVSGIVFLICEPYALLDFNEFHRQVKEQSNMVRGIIQPPYMIQYEKTSPYFYQLKHLLLYAMGLPLGLLTLIGTLVVTLETLFKIKARRFFSENQVILFILLWVMLVFGIVGGFKVKFPRYMLPLIPFFCLLGAVFVDRLIQWLPSWKTLIFAIVILTIGFSAFYSVAFVSIYHHEDPRTEASKWIYKHIPRGATLITELWDFVSIVSVDDHHPGEYRIESLSLYEPDTEDKFHKIAHQLSQGDVIILATKRIYGSILQVPERFPLTINYYKLLFDGVLGYTPVRIFTRYPSLLGIQFNDDFADESFSVYDHPKVILFRKTSELTEAEIYALITKLAPVDDAAYLLKRLIAFPKLDPGYVAFEQEEILQKKRQGISPDWAQWKAILIWLLAVELLALIAFPLTALSLRQLPDKGYAVSKVVGLLLPAYIVWILVSLKLLPYISNVILFVVGVLFIIAFLIVLKFLSFFRGIFRQIWRTFALQEGVFLLAFAGFLLFRAYNPDIFWSESSMDFSFLNVLKRTDTLPPPDPWISGFPLNYYYFGHYIVATLTKFTGIPPQITYNLAFALFPALIIIEVFSLLYNLTKRYLYGLIGVLFSAIIGNLDGFLLLVDFLRKKEHYYRFFRCAHEVIPYTVHEFPFWTFIFVDLHAHLLSMPFLVAVFLIGLNILSGTYRRNATIEFDQESKSATRIKLTLRTLIYMLIIGTLGVISSWDYPVGVIFLLLIACVKTYRNLRYFSQRWKVALRPLGYGIGVLIPGSILLYLPFYCSFSRRGIGIGPVGSATTHLSDFLLVFGFFFFVIISFLIFQAWNSHMIEHSWRIVTYLITFVCVFYAIFAYILQVNYATLFFTVFIIAFASYIFSRDWDFHSQKDTPNMYIWLCLIYASLILAGCELVFVRDFLQGAKEYKQSDTVWASYIPDWFLTTFTGEYKRMNTIFKFYIPAWFLLSFVATYMLSQLKTYYFRRGVRTSVYAFYRPFYRYLVWLWLILFGILFLFSAVFPVMGVYARRRHDVYHRIWLYPTLDGLAYLQATYPDEYRAIQWLNTRVTGTPIMLEATGADYLYEYARISANTGLPTILGWKSHADQREHWDRTHQRGLDVREIYTTTNIDRAVELLRRYHVTYVYVGRTERRDFSEAELRKFQESPEYFEVVFQSGETIIYQMK